MLILLYFKELGEMQPKWLQPIAKNAFTIFFLHAWFIFLLLGYLWPIPLFVFIFKWNILFGGVLLFVISIALSMLVALLFRKLFGKYSRMIVGA